MTPACSRADAEARSTRPSGADGELSAFPSHASSQNNPVGTAQPLLPQGLHLKAPIRSKAGKHGCRAARGTPVPRAWKPSCSLWGWDGARGQLHSRHRNPLSVSLNLLGSSGGQPGFHKSSNEHCPTNTCKTSNQGKPGLCWGCLAPGESPSHRPCPTFIEIRPRKKLLLRF